MAEEERRDPDGVARRAELRRAFEQLTHMESLSKTAFLFSDPAGSEAQDAGSEQNKTALVQIELVKPLLSASQPDALRKIMKRSLDDGEAGAWFANDRFTKKTVVDVCDAVVEVIYPADARDVGKRRAVELTRRMESPELYASVTYPHLIETAVQKDVWVANIIQGRKEQESVLKGLNSDQFLIVKDYKWQDVSNVNDLYYLAIFKDMAIRSLRDLDGRHLPALVRIRDEVLPGVASKYEVPVEQLMVYAHYHPTFWYFHLHIVNCKHSMFSGDSSLSPLTVLDRFHKLETLIALLEGNGNYYQTAKLWVLLQPNQAALYT